MAGDEDQEIKKIQILLPKIISRLSDIFCFTPNIDKQVFPITIKYPYLSLGSGAYYMGYTESLVPNNNFPKVFLPREEKNRRETTIAHEFAHWFHNIINPIGYIATLTFPRKEGVLQREAVANYAQLCYAHGKNPIINPKFTVVKLSRMGFIKEGTLYKRDLEKFYNEEILPRISQLEQKIT